MPKRRKHLSFKTCPCAECRKKRARLARIVAVTHSKTMHILMFCVVAGGLCVFAQFKWFESLPMGQFVAKVVDLVGECIADRMFPETLLIG